MRCGPGQAVHRWSSTPRTCSRIHARCLSNSVRPWDFALPNACLSWPAGLRESDGAWARYWYGSVEASTGFSPYVAREFRLSKPLMELAQAGMEHYQALYAHRLRP